LPIPPFREDGWLPVGHHPATWEEIVARLAGPSGGRRSLLTAKLLELRDALRACGVTGIILLNGSYVSAKEAPEDFDLLLVGPENIQAMKEADPGLGRLLDAERAEKEGGYSLFYLPNDSPYLETLLTFWDFTKEGVAKGSIEVRL
jgi:hypothetical protein